MTKYFTKTSMMRNTPIILFTLLSCIYLAKANELERKAENIKDWKIPGGTLLLNLQTGTVDYLFDNAVELKNTVAYAELLPEGKMRSTDFPNHSVSEEEFTDASDKGKRLIFTHTEPSSGLRMQQEFTFYEGKDHLLLRLVVRSADGARLESRDISPLSIEEASNGLASFHWENPILVDLPFDNDNWGKLLPIPWPSDNSQETHGVSHELTMVYDATSYRGLTMGSLEHDFWKTGFTYDFSLNSGILTTFTAYGGAARGDDPSLPLDYGGQDGTHDVMPHGTMLDSVLQSPLIFMEASDDFRESNANFGTQQASLAGSLEWDGKAPMYWNSFSVEDVLGHQKVMMPKDVYQIIDFIKDLDQIGSFGKPTLSIDSYDQGIYTTEVLKDIGDYARKAGQDIGFYCSPFALWTWQDNIDNAILPGTNVPLKEVILRDHNDTPIPFKTGDWGAFPMDPTHPATRDFMINQVEKAHAIGAKFIKIDFLTAGSFEAKKWHDPDIRTGMQAYDYGMRTFKHLIDSIMGDEVFISMAISPMFPHQYAHTRFVSTDVHSHLRDSQPGFAHYGSTAASMITASHMGWVQGTLWPFTNMDNLVMRKFQQHGELTEDEVKARVISLISMGSILGDGSDYRDSLSAERARKYLNHPKVAEFFSHPKAFIPIKLSKGDSMDQQLTFYLPGDEFLVSAFNFEEERDFSAQYHVKELGLPQANYHVVDFFTHEKIGDISDSDRMFSIDIKPRQAVLLRLVRLE